MELKKTPLNQTHRESGGRMVPFAGWEMPVQYSSILEEHSSVREKAGLFDVSHMGEIVVRGDNALSFLEKLTCNAISEIQDGQVQYNAVVNEQGGLVDDITVYRINSREYFIVSNASNYEKVENHFRRYSESGVDIINESAQWHQIAIQGPLAENFLEGWLGKKLDGIAYYRFKDINHRGVNYRISRTGYTGEDGFEIYSDIEPGISLWKDLLAKYGRSGLLPAGLGARDLLRLEVRYPLYGHELNEEWTPVESAIGWIVKEKKIPYLGYEKIQEQKKNGPPGRVTGFILSLPGVPRENYPVHYSGSSEPSRVLSGGHSPKLKKGIGTVYLPSGFAGEEIGIEIRSSKIAAAIHKGAFVKGAAGKK